MDNQQQKCKKIVQYKTLYRNFKGNKSSIEHIHLKASKAFTQRSKQKVAAISTANILKECSESECDIKIEPDFRSNKVLNSLLTDLVNLNNDLFIEDEHEIGEEVNKLRAKYKLPPITNYNFTQTPDEYSVTALDSIDDSNDEEDNASKYSEFVGKDSGCDVDSQSSENIDKESDTEITESKIYVDEPEFIDLELYYIDKHSEDIDSSPGISALTRDLRRDVVSVGNCEEKFSSELDYKNHRYQKHKEKVAYNQCSMCSFKCQNFNDYKQHIRQHVKRRRSSSGSSLEIIEIN